MQSPLLLKEKQRLQDSPVLVWSLPDVQEEIVALNFVSLATQNVCCHHCGLFPPFREEAEWIFSTWACSPSSRLRRFPDEVVVFFNGI